MRQGTTKEAVVVESEWRALLEATQQLATGYLEGLPERRVGPTATLAQLRADLQRPLLDEPVAALTVIHELAAAADPGLMATPSSRFFGFVIGGAVPASVAADWLTTAWDQNAGLYAAAPAAMVAEEVAAGWLTDLLGLPASVSTGFVTGCQMANTTGLAAGRHAVLQRAGWDVETQGLAGSPGVRVIVGGERHATIDRSLRLLGLGTKHVAVVPADGQGRMRADELARVLDTDESTPTIVCAQLGNVNTGALDPVADIVELAHRRGAWVHVDGAFGLWAAASPTLAPLVAGAEAADSWATDAHKWLNVPYDSGLVFCADPDAHRAAMGVQASYLIHAERQERDAMDFNPEFSRRARGFPVYAALRSLGRGGVADLVERCCALARRFATVLEATDGVEVCNDVVLNQVLVRFPGRDGDADRRTPDVVRAVQADGTCWLSGTVWQGRPAMRVSVSNWSTTPDDVDQSVAAILRCAEEVG